MSYGAFILLPSRSATSPLAVESTLRGHLELLVYDKPPTITNRQGELIVRFGDWEARIVLDDGEHVVDEAQEIEDELMAGKLTAYDDAALERARSARISTFSARLDIGCDDDPDMDHFNDYLAIVEALQDIDGAITFEHATGNFM